MSVAKAKRGSPPGKRSVVKAWGIAELWRERIIAILTQGMADLKDRALPAPRRVQKGRQATKAARALLRMAPPGLKRQARGATLALSSIRRRLGATRDVDALLETLARVAVAAGLPIADLQALQRPLAANRPTSRGAAADAVGEAMAMLAKLTDQIAKWKVPSGRDINLLDAMADDYGRLKRDAKPGLANLEIDKLHHLRKRAITHRHQLAFFGSLPDARRNKVEKRVARARKLHESIGDHRDLELLAAHLLAHTAEKTAGVRQLLLKQVLKQQVADLKRAIRMADKVMKWPVSSYRPSRG